MYFKQRANEAKNCSGRSHEAAFEVEIRTESLA